MTHAETAIRAALAAGPTPGPWRQIRDEVWKSNRRICPRVTAGESLPLGKDIERGKANASLIAACNPANMAELLAELDRLRAERKPLAERRLSILARDAQVAFCLNKASSFEVAFARAVERAHGITGDAAIDAAKGGAA